MDARDLVHLRVKLDRHLSDLKPFWASTFGSFEVIVDKNVIELFAIVEATDSNIIQIQAKLLTVIPENSLIFRYPGGLNYWKLQVLIPNGSTVEDASPANRAESSTTSKESESAKAEHEVDLAAFHPELLALDSEIKELLGQRLIGGELHLHVAHDDTDTDTAVLFFHPIRDLNEAASLYVIISVRYPNFIAAGRVPMKPERNAESPSWILRMMQ